MCALGKLLERERIWIKFDESMDVIFTEYSRFYENFSSAQHSPGETCQNSPKRDIFLMHLLAESMNYILHRLILLKLNMHSFVH